MKDNKEPKLSLVLTPVDSIDGEEGQGKAEGGEEVDRLLFRGALPVFCRTVDTMAGH